MCAALLPSAVDLTNGPTRCWESVANREAPHFYLGTHIPSWLTKPEFATVPLFVSHRRLRTRKTRFPRAVGRWALDSGGFSELQEFGRWTVTPAEYITAVHRYDTEIGGLDWAAPQDWMCEQVVIEGGQVGRVKFAGTGLSVGEHQRRTVANFVELCDRWTELSDEECPIMPVLQGGHDDPHLAVESYLECAQRYEAAGVRLAEYPVVGVGSVCRRQSTAEIGIVLAGIKNGVDADLHGFGVKMTGLEIAAHHLLSADSMAWSTYARRDDHCLDCQAAGAATDSCNNCPRYALRWRERVLDAAYVGTRPLRDEWAAWLASRRPANEPADDVAAALELAA